MGERELERERKRSELLREAFWRRAFRYTQCCAVAAVLMGFVVDDPSITVPLAQAGGLTFLVALVVK